jgi:hypothetical protein
MRRRCGGAPVREADGPEINEAVAQRKVTVGSTEQHGHHLPLTSMPGWRRRSVSRRATGAGADAGDADGGVRLLQPRDGFPGTITIQPTTFVNMLMDITRSVATTGSSALSWSMGTAPTRRWSSKQTTDESSTDARCTLSWWQIVADYWNAEVRESGRVVARMLVS